METKKTKKYTVKLNNTEKIEALLQETYDQARQQHTAIQEEINRLAGSTTFKDLDIEGKEKYGKTMANYFTLQQKAIAQKFDIAKLMAEIVKHGGDIKGAIDAAKTMPTTLDLDKLRQLAVEASSTSETQEYETKR